MLIVTQGWIQRYYSFLENIARVDFSGRVPRDKLGCHSIMV